jgi:hypothetical protein
MIDATSGDTFAQISRNSPHTFPSASNPSCEMEKSDGLPMGAKSKSNVVSQRVPTKVTSSGTTHSTASQQDT